MSNRSSNRSPSPPGLDDEKIRHTEEVLRSLFTGNLTVEEAATKLAATTIPDPNIDLEDCEEDLQVLWGRMLAYPMEPPSRVNTVASLILYISQLPPPITVSGKQLVVNEGTLRVWDDTPTLGWALHDEWNVNPRENVSPVKRQATINRFVAMNALIAKLMTFDDKRFDYRDLMLWTFRTALEYAAEEPNREAPGPDRRKCHILAAAELVKIAGHLIRHWDFEYEFGPLDGDPGAGGALWNGKHGFCKGRWELWKRRFIEVSFEEELSDEVRACAKTASETMSAYDRL